MGYPFQAADRSGTLWDPALRVGEAYVALARQAGELHGEQTGLTENERLGGSDVDLAVFQQFTQGLYDRYCSTNNLVLHGLLRGLLLPAIVMLDKGGASITRTPEDEDGLLEDLDSYVRAMWTD
ncbi:DUF6086 family protein [Streptomyces sp. NPDC057376]|uniref:DUF6086 family protein n=1 Tax=unclassified Streptomyces TaxID=2593676 RepID=UPI00093975F3|nr:DUF6086 family protein [Streptomyces sp. CB02414]OKI81235.1 hypothetical protein AMK11_24945 [Streptomyces sp. CB02414]